MELETDLYILELEQRELKANTFNYFNKCFKKLRLQTLIMRLFMLDAFDVAINQNH